MNHTSITIYHHLTLQGSWIHNADSNVIIWYYDHVKLPQLCETVFTFLSSLFKDITWFLWSVIFLKNFWWMYVRILSVNKKLKLQLALNALIAKLSLLSPCRIDCACPQTVVCFVTFVAKLVYVDQSWFWFWEQNKKKKWDPTIRDSRATNF